ncbi:MAG: NADH-quinone oxidoreductase subunit C [Candidatus Omnitrophica bacterium]|nr:NADH-quinone oxidoreductase subunit C [Candidatus Omnitrophota bacterium]MDD5237203.1 NADH-quinone oxidoreductase subunit C [Candidatus Omnitrophota bacterium]MDD5609985.1 NADH-quinone oxidoreductase subunit C [Candidatus Omnitrophota bacterium]
MLVLERVKEKLANKAFDWYEHTPRRVYFKMDPKDIKHVANALFKDLGFRFIIATGCDTPEGIEILYHFGYDKAGLIVSGRTLLKDKKKPEIDSIAPLFVGAEWIEREMWELLGINFIGHPNLKHLLLIDEWPKGDYPLRHDLKEGSK